MLSVGFILAMLGTLNLVSQLQPCNFFSSFLLSFHGELSVIDRNVRWVKCEANSLVKKEQEM